MTWDFSGDPVKSGLRRTNPVPTQRIAIRYTIRMTQLVTRIGEELAASIDELIAEGIVQSRSEAVRLGLQILIDQTRRRRTAEAIVRGYQAQPQTQEEVGWADEATTRMISEESW